MASKKLARGARDAKDTLQRNRAEAIYLVQTLGLARTKSMLADAQRDLEHRIAQRVRGGMKDTFTVAQLRATLAQVKEVLRDVNRGMRSTLLIAGKKATEQSTRHTLAYLKKADKAFRGIGEQGLALNEAAMFERASQGVNSSILRRLATGEYPAKHGILDRYGVATVGHFEKILQRGVLTKKSVHDMRREITAASPFLQQAPAHWAARIVRTETMHAYNRANYHSIQNADEQLGDMTKILSATFDDRTASDSYAVHGQIRRPEEPFESWFGLYQHPPNRPNDREIVVPHRIAWEIPEYLEQMDDDVVAEIYEAEGHKQPMPERPLMTTVALELFGTPQGRRLKGGDEGEEVDEGGED